ncbi:MAG: Spy/CpxP family protein refolding chaperone [Proteobacteria bacterium]|nr:Spy/CpxP family protein refolding chaperone [Pseudomonadota bacterium]
MRLRPLLVSVPVALAAVAGFAWLTSASAFDGGFEGMPQLAQAAPPSAPTSPPATGGGAGPMKMQRPPFSPQKMCEDQVARRIGNRAYLKARLDLKPAQIEAWNAFEKAADAASAQDKARCASLPTEVKTPPNFADRLNMREAMMKGRLESIEAVKPSLLALYATLTPEQKEILDRPHGGGGMMMRGPHGHRPG